MKCKTRDYKDHPPVINVTKTTLDILLKQEKPDQLIALYMFYCYTACWQKTLQARATTAYVSDGLGWSTKKVARVKKGLLELGLIKDVKQQINGKFGKNYIRVCYFTTHDKTSPLTETTPKCLVTSKKKYSSTLSRHSASGSRHRPSTFDKKATTKLHKTILTKKNINLDTTSWPNTFRLLRTKDKVENTRIKEVLIWYSHHLGEDYVPVAHCAKTFRAKFTRIEDAMGRADVKKEVDENGTSGIVYRKGHDGVYGYFDDSMEE